MHLRIPALAVLLTLCFGSVTRAQDADPFLWLENVYGARAQAWVAAENAKTLAVLTKDPRFETFDDHAAQILGASDRIPAPAVIDGTVYNFWQDADHVRGIWRSTPLADYAKPDPNWTTLIDLDALAASEDKNWIWQGADCDSPSRKRCLISLSEGGEDASNRSRVRSADARVRKRRLRTAARQGRTAVWLGDDTLLAAREWAPGELTASGYPYVVKKLKRGQPLEAATEIFRGAPTDLAASPFVMHDGSGKPARRDPPQARRSSNPRRACFWRTAFTNSTCRPNRTFRAW